MTRLKLFVQSTLFGVALAFAFAIGAGYVHAANVKPIVIEPATGILGQKQPADSLWDGTNPFGLMSGAFTSGHCLQSAGGALITDSGAACGGGGGASFPLYTGTTAPPLLSSFSWVNQSTACTGTTAVQGGGVGTPILAKIANCATLEWRLLTQTAPATPYTRTAWIQVVSPWGNSYLASMCFYDGTKIACLELLTQSTAATVIRVLHSNDVAGTGQIQIAANSSGIPGAGAIGFRLTNDGTNLKYSWSLDGYNWNQLYSEAVGAFITPTQVGWGGLADGSSGQVGTEYVNLQSWGN